LKNALEYSLLGGKTLCKDGQQTFICLYPFMNKPKTFMIVLWI